MAKCGTRIFKRLMKGKFDAYVLLPFTEKFWNWIVDGSTACDFTVDHVQTIFTGQQFVKPYLCVTKWRRTVCLSKESTLHVCLYFSTQKFLCLKSWCSVAIRFFATSSLVCSSRFTPWLTRTLTREKIDILGTPCLLYWFFFEFLLKKRFEIKNKRFNKMIF